MSRKLAVNMQIRVGYSAPSRDPIPASHPVSERTFDPPAQKYIRGMDLDVRMKLLSKRVEHLLSAVYLWHVADAMVANYICTPARYSLGRSYSLHVEFDYGKNPSD